MDDVVRQVTLCDVVRPLVHQPPPTLEEITAGVGRLGGVLYRMGECGLDHFAGCARPFHGPVPEARPEPMRHGGDAEFLAGGEAARPRDAATGARVRRPRRRRSCGPPLPRSPPRPSLASCRCRYRRPRTVCVVPREKVGGTGGVSRERTRPGTGDPMSASGPPSVRW